jgi:hypothetical protein
MDVDSVPGLLHRADVCHVADISEVYAASIFSFGLCKLEPEDGSSTYFRNFGNIAHIDTV